MITSLLGKAALDEKYLRAQVPGLRRAGKHLQRFMRDGGTVIVFDASEVFLDALKDVFQGVVKVREFKGGVYVDVGDDIGRGMIDREFQELVASYADLSSLESGGDRFHSVIDPGLVSYLTFMRGKAVFLQIPVPTEDRLERINRKGYIEVLCQLLTNLNVRVDTR